MRARTFDFAGDSLWNVKRFSRAANYYYEGLQIGGEEIEPTQRLMMKQKLGDALIDDRRPAEALGIYEEAVHLAALNEDADRVRQISLLIANTALGLKRYTKVKFHAEQVLVDPKSPGLSKFYAYLFQAASATAQADFAVVWQSYAAIYELYKKTGIVQDAKAYFLGTLGYVFAVIGEYDSAEEILERACCLPDGRNRASVWMARAVLFGELREATVGADSQEHYYRALEYARMAQTLLEKKLANERSPDTLKDLGTFLVRFESPERGEKLLQEALRLSPDPEIDAALGSVYAGQGKFDKSARYLRSSLLADPDRLQVRVLLARRAVLTRLLTLRRPSFEGCWPWRRSI